MISRFFIHNPVFASVISIAIAFAGLVAMHSLPIEQFPNMTPPLIEVTAVFNGANADTIANDVASPLEQQILGVENMIYMYSQNASTGNMTLEVYFEIGSDANMDQVNVQNLVSQVLSQLPEGVQSEGVVVKKQTPNILLVVAVESPKGRYDDVFLSNYTNINVVNDLELIPGISNISVIGQRNYSIRIWLRPDIMAELGITTSDIAMAVREQNKDFGIGQLGQAPNIHPVPLTVPLATQGRLSTAEEFGNIVLRADLSGNMVLLKDVARVELGAQDYTVDGALNGKTTILLPIYQQYGANALQVAAAIKESMRKIALRFPEGISYSIPYDTTLFIQASIGEVVRTIFEAAILVMIVVFVFLQSARATLIPVLALIVSIIGTFAGMYILGFSINTLTLFGMVLAIGIVVDDAIVVVENIERNMREFSLAPKEAAEKAMEEVTAPVIAIVFVLSAVFIPVAFLGGIAGQLYKQFAMTIAISVFISGLVALTLSPAIAALVLKPRKKENRAAHLFNVSLEKMTQGYLKGANALMQRGWLGGICFIALLGALGFFFSHTPTSFVPDEDQGYLIAIANLPDAASLNRTSDIDHQVDLIARQHPGVDKVVSLTGFSIIESLDRTTIGTNFIILKDWSERKGKNLSADAIAADLRRSFFEKIQDGVVIVANPPAIQGLGVVGGFEFWVENRGDGGNRALEEAVNLFLQKAKSRPELTGLHSTAQFNNLQFYVDLDRYKTKALGVPVSDVFQALQALVGSIYINNFNKYGRVYQVIAQAEPAYRERLDNLESMYVKSTYNQMVPLKSLLRVYPTKGPNLVSRFNDFPAAEIIGGPAPGYTSGQAIIAMEEIAKEILLDDMTYGWSGAAYQQISTGGSSTVVLLAGLFMVFLVLSALYEQWMMPLAILMAVPFGTLGAFLAIWIKGMPNDVYFQIGLVTLIALSAKNAILIVEFAMMKHREGMPIVEAALTAAKLRFRAILMTSLTFILGVTPLVTSQGAGAASRHSVGVGVMGGMIAATFLALLFVPLFYKTFASLQKKKEPPCE
ncbi:MAG: multidrug efflux RND transporter permease subunit [Simkaniaceae bacterium]|nr:multidrug efflux RND transporter permease subunit [Simkaniaceae bacterium]